METPNTKDLTAEKEFSHSILCVDDEVHNVEALERLFRKSYRVFKATSGEEALKIMKSEPISVIISDQRMPNMTGVEFLEQSIKIQPESIRILLTGYTDIDSIIAAINSGQIYRYVTKPWDSRELSSAVDRAIERYELNKTLALKNRELERAYQELKSLDQAKDNFMILINHELKTPLTVITSYLEILKLEIESPESQKHLNRLDEAAKRLEHMIQETLRFVSAETGLLKPNLVETDIKKVVESSVIDFNPNFKSAKKEIICHLKSCKVKTDPQILKEILSRLLENAFLHSSEKSKTQITIDNTQGSVRLEIKNPGKKISNEVLQRLTKPFVLNEDIMNHSAGLGLGLSICYALSKVIDAKFDLKSESGEIKAELNWK